MFIILFLFFLFPIYSDTYIEQHPHNRTGCIGTVQLKNIIECVLDHSPEYKRVKYDLEAIRGKKVTSGYLFPNNPVISGYGGHRQQGAGNAPLGGGLKQDYNAEFAVSQEFYMGGQRTAMMEMTEREFIASKKKVTIVERQTIADALSASLLYKVAIDEYRLIKDLYDISNDMYTMVKARAEKGLSAPVDADIAKSEAIKIGRLLKSALRKIDSAKANLTVMMGVDFKSELVISDDMPDMQLDTTDMKQFIEYALVNRPEVDASDLNISVSEKRIQFLQKSKVPNLTLGGFVQNDGFNEHVVGARISLPLQVVRDFKGEIMEETARKEQLKASSEVSRHSVRFEIIKALTNYNSLKEELESYPEELLDRIDKNLISIQTALKMGQMNIRDALISQQSMVTLRLSYLQSKAEYALARVELLRASGMPMVKDE